MRLHATQIHMIRMCPSLVSPFLWRFVERSFRNDNRLSWWLSHLSSPLDELLH